MSKLTNEERANLAMSGVQAFSNETGLDPLIELDTAVGDLIASLMHLCDMNGLEFETLLERAKGHHADEVEDEITFPSAHEHNQTTTSQGVASRPNDDQNIDQRRLYVAWVVYLYVTGQDNAYEAYKRVYGDSHAQGPQESDIDYVCRCAEQDYWDGSSDAAVYQEVFNALGNQKN